MPVVIFYPANRILSSNQVFPSYYSRKSVRFTFAIAREFHNNSIIFYSISIAHAKKNTV